MWKRHACHQHVCTDCSLEKVRQMSSIDEKVRIINHPPLIEAHRHSCLDGIVASMTIRRLMVRTLDPSRLRLISIDAIALGNLSPTTIARTRFTIRGSTTCLSHKKCFAQVSNNDAIERGLWFTSTSPRCSLQHGPGDRKPPDERTLQLGKTVRVLHDHLPTLLQSPLPGDVLSPLITLHLFPSTHPHLPTVSGRIAYVAALWTAPVAWGRVPLVGNVKLTILSERMVRNDSSSGTFGTRDEKLVVKWKTCGPTKHRDGTGGIYRGVGLVGKDPVDRIKDFISGAQADKSDATPRRPDDEEFCGIFVFEFDEHGKIVKHVIEHTDEGGRWDHMTRVVSVTDWLLGHLNAKDKDHVPGLALCERTPPDRVDNALS
nr:uncharacterized protein CFP56_73547 [Quercus suber]